MFKFQKYFLLIIPFLISIIIYSWFNTGQIISNNSEEDLNILHSQKSAEYYSTVWYPVGTGFKIAFYIPRYPVFAALGVLEIAGIPAFLRQAFLLVVIMMVGMFSMYLLIRKGFYMGNPVAIIGSIFYFLNIYSLTQIWKRFLYHHMFAWAYLPLFILLWIKWISTRKLSWLVIFLISSLFFTYAFGNPVFLLTIWAPAFIFVLACLWTERKNRKQFILIIINSLVGLILWSVVNIWWLYPTLSLGSSWTQQTGQTFLGDFNSLQAVSKSFPLNEILLLRQSWYLGHGNDWYDFYHNPLIYLISIFILAIAVLGFLKLRKNHYRKYLAGVALIGLFISKGTNFPLGYVFYYFLFSTFPMTVALRNSYEKFGLVWLLPYAIFFSYGTYWLFLEIKNRYKKIVFIALALFLTCVVLVYPMWNGDIFPPKHRVNVPQYYIEANNYLNQKSTSAFENRVFHIPFLETLEKLTYSWGYVGEDPSANLFDFESVSQPSIPFYNTFYKILPQYMMDKNFPHVLELLGVENVILHKDSIYPAINIEAMEANIKAWQGVWERREFGQLVVYSLDKRLVNPRVYAVGSVVNVNSLEDGLTKLLEEEIDPKESAFTFKEAFPNLDMQNFRVPNISFQKRAQDHYSVSVGKADGPFILILNNTFDNLWQAKIDGIPLETHFIVNGFANGWLIDKKGDYSIEIILKVWPWD